MFTAESSSTNQYAPKESIPFSARTAFVVHSNGKDTLVTKHPIADSGLGKGDLVSPFELDAIVSDFKMSEQKSSFSVSDRPCLLPERVLMDTHEYIVWYAPSTVRVKLVRRMGKLHRLRVVWPSLLFVAHKSKKSLSVYGLAFKRRPKLSDPVYVAPLWNVYHTNNLCLGSARLPDEISPFSIVEMESCIFDTVFTHTNRSGQEFREPTNSGDAKYYLNFWESLSDQNSKVFPRKSMQPLDVSLEQVLAALS